MCGSHHTPKTRRKPVTICFLWDARKRLDWTLPSIFEGRTMHENHTCHTGAAHRQHAVGDGVRCVRCGRGGGHHFSGSGPEPFRGGAGVRSPWGGMAVGHARTSDCQATLPGAAVLRAAESAQSRSQLYNIHRDEWVAAWKSHQALVHNAIFLYFTCFFP